MLVDSNDSRDEGLMGPLMENDRGILDNAGGSNFPRNNGSLLGSKYGDTK